MDNKEMFSIILNEIRESRVETNKRLDNIEHRLDKLEHRMDNLEHRMDNLEHRMDNLEFRMGGLEHRMDDLEREVKATKQLVQNFKWDIDLLTNKQATSEIAIHRLEKRVES
jgi:chromosome segregation ATPase